MQKNCTKYYKNRPQLSGCDFKPDSPQKISVKAASGWWVKGIYIKGPNGMKCVSNGYKLKKSEMVDGALFAQKGTGAKCMLWFFTGGDSLYASL